MVAQDAHAHAAPQGFIRKYVFSLDHKVIGIQYYFLALVAVFVGMALSLLMRVHMIWPTAILPIVGEIKPETYLQLAHHARHHHGVLRADHGAAERIRKLFSAHPDRRAGHGVPCSEHAFVLDDVCGVHRDAVGVFRRWRSAAAWLDRLCAAERVDQLRAR